MEYYGWTVQQIAYAKQRYNEIVGDDQLPLNFVGILDLIRWWRLREYAEPLSVKFDKVDLSFDFEWAYEVTRSFDKFFGFI